MTKLIVIVVTAIVVLNATYIAHAQQTGEIYRVGLLRPSPAAPFKGLVAALRQGLSDEGFIEGRNVIIEQRWADNQRDRLPALAADLVRRRVTVIVGSAGVMEAARAATSTIPLVFVSGRDPVKSGLVTSLSRPEGNLTSVTFFGGSLNAKRLEIIRDLVPSARVFGVLGDSNYYAFQAGLAKMKQTVRTLDRRIVVLKVAKERDFEAAFAEFVRAGVGALLISGSAFMTSKWKALIALAARHGILTIYDQRRAVRDGGLISYAASFNGAYRQAGVYAGKILKGAKTSELPVLLPTKFTLAINVKTAKALGITIPPSILLRADNVIE